MKKWMIAEVNWVPVHLGGRKAAVPLGTRYCPIVVFKSLKPESVSWSAEIYTVTHIDDGNSVIMMSYLFDEAPFELLVCGASFRLFEGSSLVATGVISKEYIP